MQTHGSGIEQKYYPEESMMMNREEKITTMNINIKGIQCIGDLKDLLRLALPDAEVAVDNFGQVLVYTGLKVKNND